jgi:hypothetical protein
MNPIVIDIPGVGPVEFPADMSQDQINAAAKKLYDEANKEPVVERESPEALGGMGAVIGAMGAAGDVIYSKGRPLFRIAEKAMGMDTGAPAVKPRTFQDPSTVAEQAIARRSVTAPDITGSPSAVKTWSGTQHGGDFLGGSEYGEADKIKKEALAFESKNPTQKVLPGSLLAVPEQEAQRLAQQRAELAAQQDVAKQAEVQKVAQTRADRLGERADLKGKANKFNLAKGTGNLGVKVAAPILGGYEAGSQGAQAYNRLTRPDLTAGDVAAGATNIVGAGSGALSMLPGKYRIPAAIISQGAGAIANLLDKRNPRNEDVEQKAAGGSVSLEAKSIPSESGMPGVGYMQTPQGVMARLQMQKELEKARLRAGVSGMAMAIPGQQGVTTMPGQMDIGANIPVGRGNLDVSARRSINPIPGRGHEQGVNARYTMPFARGGKVGLLEEAAKRFILPAAENASRTQIIGTLPTYKKAAEMLAQEGAGGRAIDFGAGLGQGAKELGKNVDTYEPFAKNWNPTFTKPEDIPTDAYGRLTNLNVLNVVPRESRDEIVQHIGRVMEPGGLGVLTTRGADVMKAQGRPGPEPMSMITSRDTYQKGFTKQELEDYLRYMLGKGYDINKLNLGPAGVMIKKK